MQSLFVIKLIYIGLWRLNPTHVDFFVRALPLCCGRATDIYVVGSKHELLSTEIVL